MSWVYLHLDVGQNGSVALNHVLLGLLQLSPMTGYDLKKHLDSSISHLWSADKAQVYRTLATMVDEGLATVHVVRGVNFPDRQEHHITDKGREVLREWLLGPNEKQTVREPFLIRVFNAGNLEAVELETLFAVRQEVLEREIAEFNAERDALGDAAQRAGNRRSFLMAATLEATIVKLEAELKWVKSTLKQLKSLPA
ncbi:PadR family transcriptional regulator [Neomicrococcus lactis]